MITFTWGKCEQSTIGHLNNYFSESMKSVYYHKWPFSLGTLLIQTPVIISENNYQDLIVCTSWRDFIRPESYTSRITDHKEVLYCDNNKNALGTVRFIRNTVINLNMCNCHLMLLVTYLYLLYQWYLVLWSHQNFVVVFIIQ